MIPKLKQKGRAGGRREGAGRKPAGYVKPEVVRSGLSIALEAAPFGSPLDVLLTAMRKLAEAGNWEAAAAVAARAAPYMHPKLAPVRGVEPALTALASKRPADPWAAYLN